ILGCLALMFANSIACGGVFYPSEFEEMASGLAFAEYPVVFPIEVQAAPVFGLYPFPGFIRVCPDTVPTHPVIGK
ncbi:MAG: hypothetical protein ABI947_20140, partial [Chloroflexota bacterium]